MAYPVEIAIRPSELAGQKNGELNPTLLYTIQGGWLLKNASIAWTAMDAHANHDGIDLKPTSTNDTYRRLSSQEAIWYERYDHIPRLNTGGVRWYKGLPWWKKPNVATAAIPGTSNHGWGLAIDVSGATGARLAWLLRWAWKYGFSWEIQSESWHLRYCLGDHLPNGVGTPTIPPPPPPQKEEDEMLAIVTANDGTTPWYATDGLTKRTLVDGEEVKFWGGLGAKTNLDGSPLQVPPQWLADIKPLD